MKLLLLEQARNSPIIKPSIHYVMHFHHLNSQEFQIVKLLKMHGKFYKQHMKAKKLVKFAKLQMLISKFEEMKMLKEETFGEFYTEISDLRNSMVRLGKQISDAKLIRKIQRSLPKHFWIKVTTIEESKDLEEMKIEEDLFRHMNSPYLQSERQRQLPSRQLRHPRRNPESHLTKTLTLMKM
jgi:RNA-binding protein YhbY